MDKDNSSSSDLIALPDPVAFEVAQDGSAKAVALQQLLSHVSADDKLAYS